ncbi:hypothetical protein [Actinoplanes sp. TFC3]|uniref:hypothetical protein n=1 Tax=Actinoplanes sp. TFC3 TaxID=1710355 RepID=UPI00083393CF|nr:hypothetical protein [Actinoplanes sp. TFC3]
MAANKKMPGTSVDVGEARASRPGQVPESPLKDGHLSVSEIVSDRAAAPSPFGDDQTFPLPVESLTYTPATTP